MIYTFRISPRVGQPFDWLTLADCEFNAWNQLCAYARANFPPNDATLCSLVKAQQYDFNEHTV